MRLKALATELHDLETATRIVADRRNGALLVGATEEVAILDQWLMELDLDQDYTRSQLRDALNDEASDEAKREREMNWDELPDLWADACDLPF